MGNLISFTSMLKKEDFGIFLRKYARLSECALGLHSVSKRDEEVYQYFWYDETSYVIECSDISMNIIKLSREPKNHVFMVSTSDWLCFLKEKFGKSFTDFYAEMYDARGLIYEEPKFISQLSIEKIKEIFRKIGAGDTKKAIPFEIDENVEIKEVNSFFNSERRFLVTKHNTNQYFFIRISDFQIIKPRISSNLYQRLMFGNFGNEYLKMLNS